MKDSIIIKGKQFYLLNNEVKSKYSSSEYINRKFGTDICLYYLGKNQKGIPQMVVECRVCGEVRQINAYNLGRRTLKKCDCLSKKTNLENLREKYSRYINTEKYGLKITGLRQNGRHFYFSGLCKHNNFVEVNAKTFLEEKIVKCKCENVGSLRFSDNSIVEKNKRWLNKFYSYIGTMYDDTKIIDVVENEENIDLHKNSGYRTYSFLVECTLCNRRFKTNAYRLYLYLTNSSNKDLLDRRKCICKRSIYMDKNFIGQIFGRLRIDEIEYDEKSGEVNWLCTCMCKEKNKVKNIAGIIYSGSHKSCGCLRRESIQNNSPYSNYNYIGKIYGSKNGVGGLKVLSIDLDSMIMGIQWNCECLFCGDVVKLPAGQVVKGSLQSCGCHHTENTTYYKDKKFIGKIFNNIEVIDILDNRGKGYYWRCKCLYCGKYFEELGSKVANGRKISCGCLQGSFYEQYISFLLDKANILYRREVSFTDLVSDKNRKLRYDFAIYLKNSNTIKYLIEYDGQQHFDVNAQINVKSLEEAKEKLKQIQKYDKIKNEYAKNHKIPLKRFNKYNINDIEVFIQELKRC